MEKEKQNRASRPVFNRRAPTATVRLWLRFPRSGDCCMTSANAVHAPLDLLILKPSSLNFELLVPSNRISLCIQGRLDRTRTYPSGLQCCGLRAIIYLLLVLPRVPSGYSSKSLSGISGVTVAWLASRSNAAKPHRRGCIGHRRKQWTSSSWVGYL
jgi:hypothetical protein